MVKSASGPLNEGHTGRAVVPYNGTFASKSNALHDSETAQGSASRHASPGREKPLRAAAVRGEQGRRDQLARFVVRPRAGPRGEGDAVEALRGNAAATVRFLARFRARVGVGARRRPDLAIVDLSPTDRHCAGRSPTCQTRRSTIREYRCQNRRSALTTAPPTRNSWASGASSPATPSCAGSHRPTAGAGSTSAAATAPSPRCCSSVARRRRSRASIPRRSNSRSRASGWRLGRSGSRSATRWRCPTPAPGSMPQ